MYWAGRDCGWRFLASTVDQEGWPRFNRAYQQRCATALAGEKLPEVPAPEAPPLESQALRGDAALLALRRLRKEHGL